MKTSASCLPNRTVPDLFGRVAYLIDTVDAGAYSMSAYPLTADSSTTGVFEAVSGSGKFRPAASNAEGLRTNEDVKEFYLGLSSAGRKSFKDVKHYRRRKRWLS